MGVAAPIAAAQATVDRLLPATARGADATFGDFATVGTGALVGGLGAAGAGALALRAGSAAARGAGHGAIAAGLAIGGTAFTGLLLTGSVWEWALANAGH